MFTFDYHLLGSVGLEVLSPSLGPLMPQKSSFNKRRLCGTLSKAFEKSSRITSIWPLLSIPPAMSSAVRVGLCFTGTPLEEAMLSIIDDVV